MNLWLRYHWAELCGVVAPTTAAFTINPWFGTLTVITAGQWIRHELHNRIPPMPTPPPDSQLSLTSKSDRSA